MSNFNPAPSDEGGPLTTREFNTLKRLVSCIRKMVVTPPLTLNWPNDIPTLGLSGGWPRSCKTSSTITARVGAQMGKGTIKPYRTLPDGKMVEAGGPDLTAYSKFGVEIPSGVWCGYSYVDSVYEIHWGDCSGNP